jgi:protein ImuA
MDWIHSDIVQQLRQEILLRQGFRPPSAAVVDMGLGAVASAFPMGVFPTGAMHELVSDGAEGAAAGGGWTAALVGRLMAKGGACVWIGPRRNVFPPGLVAFGAAADRVIFVDLRREKDALWALEEALKCEGLAAVVGEVRDVSWITSRRFQLAVEQSRVTGFLLRDRPKSRQPIAAVARWRVTPLAGGRQDGMPGVGFPRWSVELLRMRSGQPGKWEIEWRNGNFQVIEACEFGIIQGGGERRKTG